MDQIVLRPEPKNLDAWSCSSAQFQSTRPGSLALSSADVTAHFEHVCTSRCWRHSSDPQQFGLRLGDIMKICFQLYIVKRIGGTPGYCK